MVRAKQTARRVMPSYDEVGAALVVASVKMEHGLAPPTPALSSARCKFAIEWTFDTYGSHFFTQPVDWKGQGLFDYPRKVQYPMDLDTLRAYADQSDFCFATLLDRSRLIWANACVYNGDAHPIAECARRVAKAFESKIVAGEADVGLERLGTF